MGEFLPFPEKIAVCDTDRQTDAEIDYQEARLTDAFALVETLRASYKKHFFSQ